MGRFTRLALVLLVIHYLAETVFHICRILAYSEKTSISSKLFKLGDLLFVLARLSSVILAVCFLQAWLMWNFIVFQFKRMRETKPSTSAGSGSAMKTRKTEQEKA